VKQYLAKAKQYPTWTNPLLALPQRLEHRANPPLADCNQRALASLSAVLKAAHTERIALAGAWWAWERYRVL